MKVVKMQESLLVFDTGLEVIGDGDIDCCANNYLDFEQLPVGTELPTMSVGEFVDTISIKKDGFAVKDINGIPKWVQARSDQNGYYSNITVLVIKDGVKEVRVGKFNGLEKDQ